jgi:hypothetical protein
MSLPTSGNRRSETRWPFGCRVATMSLPTSGNRRLRGAGGALLLPSHSGLVENLASIT